MLYVRQETFLVNPRAIAQVYDNFEFRCYYSTQITCLNVTNLLLFMLVLNDNNRYHCLLGKIEQTSIGLP